MYQVINAKSYSGETQKEKKTCVNQRKNNHQHPLIIVLISVILITIRICTKFNRIKYDSSLMILSFVLALISCASHYCIYLIKNLLR